MKLAVLLLAFAAFPAFADNSLLHDGVYHGEPMQKQNTATFGQDNRYQLPVGQWPMIGKVTNNDEWCTGTLVAPCVVLTAAHCINESVTTTFRGSNDGPSSTVIQTYWGTSKPNQFYGADWELLVLKERLGDTLGWMGVKNWSGPDTNEYGGFTAVGYGNDLLGGAKATVDNKVTIRKTFADNSIYHDANGNPGNSGGPIFGTYSGSNYIVAIYTRDHHDAHYTGYSESAASIGVASAAFLPTLKQVIAKWCPTN